MQGTINVGYIMEQSRIEQETADQQAARCQAWLEEQHLYLVHMAWEHYGKAGDDELARQEVIGRWGDVLTEAQERMAAYRRWLRQEHLPRVHAWCRRVTTATADPDGWHTSRPGHTPPG